MSHEKVHTQDDLHCEDRQVLERRSFDLTKTGKYARRVTLGCPEDPADSDDLLVIKNSPKITRIAVSDNLEKSHIFQDGVKEFRIRAVKPRRVRVSYTGGETVDNGDYYTVGLGGIYHEERLRLSGPLTIFYKLIGNSSDIEILEWT